MRAVGLLAAVALAACGGGGGTYDDRELPKNVGNPSATERTAPPTPADCADRRSAATFEIVQRDFSFEPSCIKVRAEQGFALKNTGSVTHNLSVAGWDVDLDVEAGQEGNYEAIGGVVEAGTYPFSCKYHAGRGMRGTIVVEGEITPLED